MSAVKLAFDIGKSGGRTYAVKGQESFVKTVESSHVLEPSKTQSISFSEEELSEESNKWYQLIIQV